MKKHPLAPFNEKTARQKIQMAGNAWNNKDPVKVCQAYSVDIEWRNHNQFINGREEVQAFLTNKWETD